MVNFGLPWLKFVSIEPALFLVSFIVTVYSVIQTNLYLQKACRFNATAEPNLRVSNCDNVERGVEFTSFVSSHFYPIKMLAVIVLVAICTSWSDNLGKKRKPFLVLPCVGLLAQSLLGCAHSYWWSWPPIYAAAADVVCNVLLGHAILFGIFAQIHVSDESTAENRTTRFGLLYGLRLLGEILGKGASGYLLNWIGFLNSYALCSVLSALTLIMTVVMIRDNSVPIETVRSKSCSIFDVGRRIRQSWKIVFGLPSKRQKYSIMLLLLLQCLLYFAHEGEFTVMYLYLRYRFEWDERMYSVFQVCGSIGLAIGTVFTSLILSKTLKIPDTVIGMIAGSWDSIIALAFFVSTQNWQFYLVNTLDLFYGVAHTVGVSCMTKFYPSRQQGHFFSVLITCSIPVPACHIVYNVLFQKTLHTFPNAFFLLTFGLYVITAFINSVVHFLTRNLNVVVVE